MGEALLVFWTGSAGVFLGMGLLYAAIRLVALVAERRDRGEAP